MKPKVKSLCISALAFSVPTSNLNMLKPSIFRLPVGTEKVKYTRERVRSQSEYFPTNHPFRTVLTFSREWDLEGIILIAVLMLNQVFSPFTMN